MKHSREGYASFNPSTPTQFLITFSIIIYMIKEIELSVDWQRIDNR